MPKKKDNPAPVIEPEVIDPEAPAGIDPNVIQIRTKEGWLLFCYRPSTDSVEVKMRGKLYAVSIGKLQRTIFSNVFNDVTIHDIVADETPIEEKP